ncbi:MAG: M61 family metallopeptidase [Longimicrobiaceae bacterium]
MPGILYRLSLAEPHTHLFRVEIAIKGVQEPQELAMPSWTPGSYLLREFPRNVQEFHAEDGAGRTLGWQKTDKNRWRIEEPADGALGVRYAVYANELTVRTSHLDASHGYVNGAGVFMYVAGREAEEATVEIDAPAGWRATTALRDAGSHRFHARDYDELVDSPIEIGTHELLEFEVAGRPHRYAIWGHGNYDPQRLIADTRKIVLAEQELFGVLPYEEFTFILHLVPGGYGGLEHRSSTSLLIDRWSFRGEEYERFLGLVAHELFHAWNGKRIRPAPLGPFDYTRENYTRNLWVVEGLTTYYTDLILRRAGLITPERYLVKLEEAINRLQSQPGRQVQTLEESSFDAWIKFYRPDEHTPNSQISYYQKGALVGLLLDLRIRSATEGTRSLDDVMGLLWERYGAPDRGFPEAGEESVIERIAQEVCGEPLGDFFDRYLRSTAELEYGRHLAAAGIELTPADTSERPSGESAATSTNAAEPAAADSGSQVELGVRLKEEGNRTLVTHVLADTPAYRAGLNANDEILALDGLRVNSKGLAARLAERQPGERATLTLFRRDELLTLAVELEPPSTPRVRLTRVTDPTNLQEAIYRDWLRIAG